MKLVKGLMVAALLAPGAAFAHGSVQDSDVGSQKSGMGQSGTQLESQGSMQNPQVGEQGTLHGKVTSIDLKNGIAKVKTQDKTVKLYGSPDELASLQAGQEQDISFSKFGSFMWISQSQAGQGLSGAQSSGAMNTQSAQPMQFQGKVLKLDADKGKIVLLQNEQKITFHAHPQLLQSISSGQQVSGSYTKVGGQKWIKDISPASGAGMSGGQSGTQDQGSQSGTFNQTAPSGSDQGVQPGSSESGTESGTMNQAVPPGSSESGTQPGNVNDQTATPPSNTDQDRGTMDQNTGTMDQNRDKNLDQNTGSQQNP